MQSLLEATVIAIVAIIDVAMNIAAIAVQIHVKFELDLDPGPKSCLFITSSLLSENFSNQNNPLWIY